MNDVLSGWTHVPCASFLPITCRMLVYSLPRGELCTGNSLDPRYTERTVWVVKMISLGFQFKILHFSSKPLIRYIYLFKLK